MTQRKHRSQDGRNKTPSKETSSWGSSKPLKEETFICLDCETTGLDPVEDRLIEIAVIKFTFDTTVQSFESLINPNRPIPENTIEIHHITDVMVQDKPTVDQVLREALRITGNHIIVGHGIQLDIAFICQEAKRHQIPCTLDQNPFLDTLRMARLYGESPVNSLERLRKHFNIADEGAHRAMSDVIVNIEVFKYLAKSFATTKELFDRMKKPILLKTMPLGKHKGRSFADIPIEYLNWAAHKDFDQDLTFSIRSELKRRKAGHSFHQASSPFEGL